MFPTNESADTTSTVVDVVMNALVDSGDNRMWPWYGDLISDPNNDDIDAPHVRYPTTFYRKFKRKD